MTKPKDKKHRTTAAPDELEFGAFKNYAVRQDGTPTQYVPGTEHDVLDEHGNRIPVLDKDGKQIRDQDGNPMWQRTADEVTRPPAPEEIDDEDEGQDEEDSVEHVRGEPVLTIKETAFLKLLAHASTCDQPGCAVKVDWSEGCGFLAPARKWPLCEAGRELRKKL